MVKPRQTIPNFNCNKLCSSWQLRLRAAELMPKYNISISNISRCQKKLYIIRFKFLSQFQEQNEKSCKVLPFISNYLEILKNIQYFRLLEIAKKAPGESNRLKI